jgi:hypothetical protein
MPDSPPNQLILPGPAGWEAWQSGEGGKWTRTGEAAPEAKPWTLARSRSPWVLGVPSLAFQTLPLKFPADSAGIDELVPLRLESAGWDPGPEGQMLFDWQALPGGNGGTAVLAWLMEGRPLEGCPAGRVPQSLQPAFLLRSWPAERIVLWQEHSQWLLAVTAGSLPVNIQMAGGFDDPATAAGDLRGQIASLVLRGLARQPKALVVVGIPEPGTDELAAALGLPLETLESLPLRGPAAASRLLPAEILLARQARIEARRWKGRIAAFAALWLAGAAWTSWGYFQAQRELESAREAAAAAAPPAAAVREVQAAWDEVLTLNSVDSFPLEILLRISEVLPSRAVRLTSFTVESDRDVFLRGTAPQPTLALKFAETVRRAPALGGFSWDTPYPTSENDGSATFTMQGKFKPLGAR